MTRIGLRWAFAVTLLIVGSVWAGQTALPLARAFLALWQRGLPLADDAGAVQVASRSDDVALLEALRAAGTDLAACNPEGGTALHVAAANGAANAAAYLIANGVGVDERGPAGPPLAVALEEGHLDVARVLLDHGADKRVRIGRERRPVLVQAALTGDVRKAHQLLELGIPPDVADDDGRTALAHAVARDDEAMARTLLEAGATTSVEPVGPDRSLLEQAIRSQSEGIVDLLLAHGADPTMLSREGQPLVFVAVAMGHPEIVEALLDAGVPVDTEMGPVSEEFLALVPGKHSRYYLTRDAGVRPLMVAVLRGDREMARLLIERGASLSPTRGLVKYPLGMAADRRDNAMMQVLLGRDPEEAEQARRIVVSLSTQQATLFESGEATLKTRISTGRKGYRTPPGEYVITNKHRLWRSNLYPADMPYFLRLSGSAMGLHAGAVPRQPASHGCIRLPSSAARTFYQRMQLGDPVVVVP